MKLKTIKEKGFALTFDAMVGVLLIMIVMLYIGWQRYDLSSSQILVQKNLADDLLELSIDLNVLQSYSNDDINAFFIETIPTNYQYHLKIDRYTGSGGTLVAGPSYVFGDTITDKDTVDYVESRGAFLTYPSAQSSDIESYNMVKLKIWVKESVKQLPQ